MTTLQVGQAQLGGVTIGLGTSYPWASPLEGTGLPSLRSDQLSRGARPGRFPGSAIGDQHLYTITVIINGADRAEFDSLRDVLLTAWAPSDAEQWLTLRPISNERQVLGQPVAVTVLLDFAYNGIGTARLEFATTRPYEYGAEATVSFGQAVSSGGFTFPLTFPWTFGSAGTGGQAQIVNDGNADASWTAIITGPIDAPRLEHIETGVTLSLSGSLAAGEQLFLDSDRRSILLDGTASRYLWVIAGSDWPALAPGTNTIRLAGASGTGTVDITSRSAWWG